jgi:hypothetical protein
VEEHEPPQQRARRCSDAFAVFFAEGGIAFHEGSLDRPSAGCVRLGHADAVEFYNVLQLDDRVQVR